MRQGKGDDQKRDWLSPYTKADSKKMRPKGCEVLREKKVAQQDPCNKVETQRTANKMRENNDG